MSWLVVLAVTEAPDVMSLTLTAEEEKLIDTVLVDLGIDALEVASTPDAAVAIYNLELAFIPIYNSS